MKYTVISTPNAKESQVIEDGGVLRIKVNAPSKEGKANERLIEILSEHFDIPKSFIKILSGHTSRHKIVEIVTL